MIRILCPTDFSHAANNAIAYAAKLCQKLSGTLTLFNVQSYFTITPDELFRGASTRAEHVGQELQQQCSQVSKAFKISCDAEVSTSFKRLSNVIAEHGKDFDLIVMGTDGEDDLYQVVTGSNTYNAILHASIPVMVIPENFIYTDISHVVYPFYYSDSGMLSIPQIFELFIRLNCKITILLILEEAYSLKQEASLDMLQSNIRSLFGADYKIEFQTFHGSDISAHLYYYLQDTNADVLVISVKQHSFIKRLFRKDVLKYLTASPQRPLLAFRQ